MAHFTVTGGNEAGVDIVLIQPFLFYYVNLVTLMLTRGSQWGQLNDRRKTAKNLVF